MELRAYKPDTSTAPRPLAGGGVTDACLIERCIDGQMRAFDALVARYERQAFWIAYRVLGNSEDARDVVQDAFVRVYGALERFDFSKSFYTWLYRIVTNLAIDANRRARAKPALQLEGGVPDVPDEGRRAARPDGVLEQKEQARKVHEILLRLPEMFRTILTLRDLQGLSCREIAAITGLPHTTVRWRLYQGRKVFRRYWERLA